MGCTQSTTAAASTTEPVAAPPAEGVVAEQTTEVKAEQVAVDEAPAAAPATEETPAPAEETPAAAPVEPTPELPKTFVIATTSIENNVVLYHVQDTTQEGDEPKLVKKRFNDFKVFHQKLTNVPALPAAGLVTRFKRSNAQLIQDRQTRLQDILNAAPKEQVDAFLAEPVPAPASVAEEAAAVAEAPAAEAVAAPAVETTPEAEVKAEEAPEVKVEATEEVKIEAALASVAVVETKTEVAAPEAPVKVEEPVVTKTTQVVAEPAKEVVVVAPDAGAQTTATVA
ncbi:hypothetical protein AeMF1_020261 [Aphanomyces euteiches]|nr:hypothetical protein AeMF1_020261 [Aphanomyces euteiches]